MASAASGMSSHLTHCKGMSADGEGGRKMKTVRFLFAVGMLAVVAACASSEVPATGPGVTDTSAGKVLVDSSGMTLYTYDKDGPGSSTCTGVCAVAWPPALASDNARPTDGFSVIERPDGSTQWAHNGSPLYAYIRDNEPGDVKGNGAYDVWHVAHP
jgi:predicted lipoprotein with Yx(FWY)xxD motif